MAYALEIVTERGCLNLASSGISGDTITIQPQIYDSYWQNFYFKITGATSWQPAFECEWGNNFNYSLATAVASNVFPRYTYTPNDPSSWVAATANSSSGTKLTWTFPSAFTSDTVYISLYPIVSPSMILSWITGLSGISETAAAVAFGGDDYQYGTIASVTDVNSRVIPAQKQYCFKFGTGSKVAVLFGGVHASEDLGSIVLMQAVDTLLESSPLAVQARAAYTFYVYPMINPQGRYGGHYRATFEDGYTTIDPNRDWIDTTDFVLDCTQNTRDAVNTDVTVADIDCFLDFHSKGVDATLYRYNTTASTAEIAFYTCLTRYQDIITTTSEPGITGTAARYYGASADLAHTAEMGQLSSTGDKYASAVTLGEALAATIAQKEWALNISNKKYGIDFGNNNAERYYKILSDSALSFPNDDWVVGFWIDSEDNAGTAYQYIYCMGTVSSTNSFMIFYREASVATPNSLQLIIVDGSDVSFSQNTPFATGDAEKKLIVVQRETINGVAKLRVYACIEGESITTVFNETCAFGAVSASDLYIGNRNDLTATRFFEEHIGGIFKADFALEKWQIEEIAWGLAKPSDFGTLSLDLPMESAAATLTDLASSLTATRYGTNWPDPSIEFVYATQSGSSSLPINRVFNGPFLGPFAGAL